MTVGKKIGIVVVVVILLALAAIIPWLTTRQRVVPTVGELVYLSDSNSAGHQHVWITGPTGTDAKELTHGAENDLSPSFSPDGSQIVYVSDKSGDPEVTVMDADGLNPHAVTIGTDAKDQAQFTPDGESITYLTRGILTELNIRGHSADQLLPVTQNATSADANERATAPRFTVVKYAWAPVTGNDTSNTALAAVQQADDGTQQLVLLPKDGSAPVSVANGAMISLAWSSDATRLYGAVMGLSAFNPGAANASKLPKGMTMAPVPKNQQVSGIFAFGADGGLIPSAHPLGTVPSSTFGPQNPSISPDGTRIAYEVWPSTTPNLAKIGMFWQPIDASQRAVQMMAGPISGLKWAPDGVHFCGNIQIPKSPGKQDVVIFDLNAHTGKSLTKGTCFSAVGAWSPQIPKS